MSARIITRRYIRPHSQRRPGHETMLDDTYPEPGTRRAIGDMKESKNQATYRSQDDVVQHKTSIHLHSSLEQAYPDFLILIAHARHTIITSLFNHFSLSTFQNHGIPLACFSLFLFFSQFFLHSVFVLSRFLCHFTSRNP